MSELTAGRRVPEAAGTAAAATTFAPDVATDVEHRAGRAGLTGLADPQPSRSSRRTGREQRRARWEDWLRRIPALALGCFPRL